MLCFRVYEFQGRGCIRLNMRRGSNRIFNIIFCFIVILIVTTTPFVQAVEISIANRTSDDGILEWDIISEPADVVGEEIIGNVTESDATVQDNTCSVANLLTLGADYSRIKVI